MLDRCNTQYQTLHLFMAVSHCIYELSKVAPRLLLWQAFLLGQQALKSAPCHVLHDDYQVGVCCIHLRTHEAMSVV